jgi:hypothetical protein
MNESMNHFDHSELFDLVVVSDCDVHKLGLVNYGVIPLSLHFILPRGDKRIRMTTCIIMLQLKLDQRIQIESAA